MADRREESPRRSSKNSKSSEATKEKRKSRKRSQSCERSSGGSRTSSSSSSNSPVRKKSRTSKSKKRRSKRHSSTKSSSSNESSDSETNKKTHEKAKGKEEKKTHQGKKRRKKKDKRNKEKKSKLAVNQEKYGKYGILVDSDMFNKQQEFYLWLQEVKKINPEVFPRFEMKKMFETFAEDYNTVTLPHKKFYDLEKWEAKQRKKGRLKALKKAQRQQLSIENDELRHKSLHSGPTRPGMSKNDLLEMQRIMRERQQEDYKKKAGLLCLTLPIEKTGHKCKFKMADGGLTSHALQRFSELEELAQEIMEDKHQIVELDKKRNTNREALRALKKEDTSGLKTSKSWVCFGSMFLKLPSSNIQSMLQQDQKNLDEEIGRLRKDLKPKVSKLHELEGLPEVKGFDLTALTQDDLQNLKP